MSSNPFSFVPTIYLSIDYYGNGQYALDIDEATIEDHNGTFTCLALNAAGRVQITADVFVHEKGNTLICVLGQKEKEIFTCVVFNLFFLLALFFLLRRNHQYVKRFTTS